MKILLTGASSFTGYWFAEALAKAGHLVVAPLRGSLDGEGGGERYEHIKRLQKAKSVDLIADCGFGTPRFLNLVGSQEFDILCFHHAEVRDYRSPDFDVAKALTENTRGLRDVLKLMGPRGLKSIVLTGSFFEQDEGAGSPPLFAFSAYGLSKGLTAQVIQHCCREFGVRYGKFVIPHPFGPFEQPRLGAYLARTWREGKTAEIKTPAYIRDNIHVDLLAACYARFVGEVAVSAASQCKLNPSGYIEAQGAFVERMAREISRRVGFECKVKLLTQTEFSEPMIRVNTDPAIRYAEGWDEAAAWDAYSKSFIG